jgi:hypothetical protein
MAEEREEHKVAPGAVPFVENETSLAQEVDLEFHPIEIQGEPLSETVIRERKRRFL